MIRLKSTLAVEIIPNHFTFFKFLFEYKLFCPYFALGIIKTKMRSKYRIAFGWTMEFHWIENEQFFFLAICKIYYMVIVFKHDPEWNKETFQQRKSYCGLSRIKCVTHFFFLFSMMRWWIIECANSQMQSSVWICRYLRRVRWAKSKYNRFATIGNIGLCIIRNGICLVATSSGKWW